MRVSSIAVGILAVALAASFVSAQQPQPSIAAGQLVREVVYNELNDHRAHGYWRYWIERNTPAGTRLEDQIETADGPVTRLELTNGRPLSEQSEQQEQARLQHLLRSREEQIRHLEEYKEDEQRIGRILALLPDAFLYQYAGDENGCHKMNFHPNPNYPAHSIEARVFHAMSGTLWVDARFKRLVRIDAHVEENVDFGYGILGRLYKNGWLQLVRTQVSPTDWKTNRLEVHMTGRALLVKSFARETSETRGGYAPVPAGLSLAQGMTLLDHTQAQSENGLAKPASFAASR